MQALQPHEVSLAEKWRPIGVSVSDRIVTREKMEEGDTSRQLVFGITRSGAGGETLVFIPAMRANQLATIHRSIRTAKTWGEFIETLPEQERLELLEVFQQEDTLFDPDAQFKSEMLPGFCDGDWPDWPEQKMMRWLPSDVVGKYGKVHQSVLNGSFISFDPNHIGEMQASLRKLGYTCRRDDQLIGEACGQIPFEAEA